MTTYVPKRENGALTGDCGECGQPLRFHRGSELRCGAEAEPRSLLVRQEDPQGCGVACLAMATGRSYAQVRADLAADERYDVKDSEFIEGGLDHTILAAYLHRQGFWLQKVYRKDRVPREDARGEGGRYLRHHTAEWPPEPWAPDGHIAQVLQPSNNTHFVFVTANGVVLDPLHGERESLREWEQVYNVTGLLRAATPTTPDSYGGSE